MKFLYKLFVLYLLLAPGTGFTQSPAVKHIRIVDTLTVQEKTTRDPVLLRSELDSLVARYQPAVQPVSQEPVIEKAGVHDNYVLAGLFLIIALVGWMIFQFYRQQKRIDRTIAGLKEKPAINGLNAVTGRKARSSDRSLDAKIRDLDAELHKLAKENEGLQRVIKEYNGIQHEYDSLKQGMQKAYKIRNYPGYEKSKDETMMMQGVLDTEKAVAVYAYEKFLKPVLVITDNNKNSPAKLSPADQEKLLDLLLSLSLYYIEYLYLRVNDLAIGGKMVERIQAFSKGKPVDPSLLKKLDTEFGSRALVIRMALQRIAVNKLSYPVFDETNLNQ